MSGDTEVLFTGRLGGDPELRFTPQGHAVASFSVGVNARIRQADGSYVDGETTWHRVSVWRDQAEHVAASLAKGDRVMVSGYLRARSYEKDGEKRLAWEVEAREVGATLRFAGVKVDRPARQAQAAADPWSATPAPVEEPPF